MMFLIKIISYESEETASLDEGKQELNLFTLEDEANAKLIVKQSLNSLALTGNAFRILLFKNTYENYLRLKKQVEYNEDLFNAFENDKNTVFIYEKCNF